MSQPTAMCETISRPFSAIWFHHHSVFVYAANEIERRCTRTTCERRRIAAFEGEEDEETIEGTKGSLPVDCSRKDNFMIWCYCVNLLDATKHPCELLLLRLAGYSTISCGVEPITSPVAQIVKARSVTTSRVTDGSKSQVHQLWRESKEPLLIPHGKNETQLLSSFLNKVQGAKFVFELSFEVSFFEFFEHF